MSSTQQERQNDPKVFLVLFHREASIEYRREIADDIRKIPDVKLVELSDHWISLLRVELHDIRSRRQVISQVKEMPGVREVERVTYYKILKPQAPEQDPDQFARNQRAASLREEIDALCKGPATQQSNEK